jgi:cytochrome c oxidase assembly protein Cox11
MTASASPVKRKGRLLIIAMGIVFLAANAWWLWRQVAPIEVRLVSEVNALPFEVTAIPAVVYARPGEMVNVTYRIHNKDQQPIVALGKIELEPEVANTQVKIFMTQCGGVNTFQNEQPRDYYVTFRVQAAGLTGASQITLRHRFMPADSQ